MWHQKNAFSCWARWATSRLAWNLEIPQSNTIFKHQCPSKQQPEDRSDKELLKQLTSQHHTVLINFGQNLSNPSEPLSPAGSKATVILQHVESLLASRPRSRILPRSQLCSRHFAASHGWGRGISHAQVSDIWRALLKQYQGDMVVLQIQMYQLSRLLHDYHRDLCNHFEEHETGPQSLGCPLVSCGVCLTIPTGICGQSLIWSFFRDQRSYLKLL